MRHKTFVNVGDDQIYMKQQVPNLFLIPDLGRREAVVQEYLKDHSMTRDELRFQLEEQIQKHGGTFIKTLIQA